MKFSDANRDQERTQSYSTDLLSVVAVMHFFRFSLLHALVVLAATLRFHHSVGAVNVGHVHLAHPHVH